MLAVLILSLLLLEFLPEQPKIELRPPARIAQAVVHASRRGERGLLYVRRLRPLHVLMRLQLLHAAAVPALLVAVRLVVVFDCARASYVTAASASEASSQR